MDPQLVKHKYGFYHYEPKPSLEELEAYYRDKYYQQGCGSYDVDYTDEELKYFQLRARLIATQFKRLSSEPMNTFLDIGCGEGWLLNEFNQIAAQARGVDFSSYGVEKLHPHLKESITQADIYQHIDALREKKEAIDVIALANVIEHVLDPVELIEKLYDILSSHGWLIIVAPNDFSQLQEHLLNKGFIDKEFWLSYPDHLSYFNKDSMCRLLQEKDFAVKKVVAENPIDLNLLNKNSNYIEDVSKGKNTHYYRVFHDNLLASIDEDKLLDLYGTLGDMGLGRDLVYFVQKL